MITLLLLFTGTVVGIASHSFVLATVCLILFSLALSTATIEIVEIENDRER